MDKGCILGSNFLVHNVKTKSISSTLDLGDHISNLLDSVHLFPKELSLQEITEMGISLAITSLVQVKKTLVHSFLQLQGCLHGLKRRTPLRAAGLGNVLEDNLPSTLGLIFHQLHTVLALLIGALLEEGCKAVEGLVIPVEERRHGEMDIAGIELHVDLLVDQCFALLMVVLSDLGSHLVIDVVVVVVVLVASTHSGAASYQLV